jgi:P4 family phage/plasmid primase-like protien
MNVETLPRANEEVYSINDVEKLVQHSIRFFEGTDAEKIDLEKYLVDTFSLIQKYFLTRLDYFAFAPPWDAVACPFKETHLKTKAYALLSHLSKHTDPTQINWVGTRGDKEGWTGGAGHWRNGMYQLIGTKVRWFCLDFDGSSHKSPLKDPLQATLRIRKILLNAGLTVYLEKSGSGTGYHLWGFFEKEGIEAEIVRTVLLSLIPNDIELSIADITDIAPKGNGMADPKAGRGIEIFPKQGSIKANGFGNMVWLPWWHSAKDGGNQFYKVNDQDELTLYLPDSFDFIPNEKFKTLHSEISKREEKTNPKKASKKNSFINPQDDLTRARLDLDRLSPWRCNDHDSWVKVGMALSSLGDTGLSLWEEWSRQSEKYKSGECTNRWRSFTPNDGITLGSLFHWADEDDPSGRVKKDWKSDSNSNGSNINADSPNTTLPIETILEALKGNEWGDSTLFIELFKDHLLYDHSNEKWYVWSDHHWKLDETDYVNGLIPSKLAGLYAETIPVLNEQKKGRSKEDQADIESLIEKIGKRIFALKSVARGKNVLKFSEHKLGITGREWDANPNLLGVANGVLDLERGEPREGKREDYIRTVSPTEWQGIDTPAPRFEQFLHEIFEDKSECKEIVSTLQRLFGYAITGHTTEHILPIFHGAQGRNGKDVLFETLAHVLGPVATAGSTDLLLEDRHNVGSATPHLRTLQGKRLVWTSETNEGARLNPGQVKLITGGGRIMARNLHENPVEFDPTHTLFLITNNAPHCTTEDDALWERLVLARISHGRKTKSS